MSRPAKTPKTPTPRARKERSCERLAAETAARDARITALEARLAGLEGRIATLEEGKDNVLGPWKRPENPYPLPNTPYIPYNPQFVEPTLPPTSPSPYYTYYPIVTCESKVGEPTLGSSRPCCEKAASDTAGGGA